MRISLTSNEYINDRIRTALKRSHGFKTEEYGDTMIFFVA